MLPTVADVLTLDVVRRGKAETAHRLGLARPTVYQRVRQIEQLLRISLDSAESRLAVHAALLALRASL